MAVSCIISEIEILVENRESFIPSFLLAYDAPIRGSLSEYFRTAWYEKTRMV